MYHSDIVQNNENMSRKINFNETSESNRCGNKTYVRYTHMEFHPQMMLA